MKNGWFSVYSLSLVGGLNEKMTKQLFPGKDILCITALNQEGIYALGVKDYGVSLIKIDLGTLNNISSTIEI